MWKKPLRRISLTNVNRSSGAALLAFSWGIGTYVAPKMPNEYVQLLVNIFALAGIVLGLIVLFRGKKEEHPPSQ